MEPLPAQQRCPGGNRLRGCLCIYFGYITGISSQNFSKENEKKILKTLAGYVSDLANLTENPLGGLQGVSRRFPPGHHCWATRYILSKLMDL